MRDSSNHLEKGLGYTPFKRLGKALRKERRRILLSKRNKPTPASHLLNIKHTNEFEDQEEYLLFLREMEGVTPIDRAQKEEPDLGHPLPMQKAVIQTKNMEEEDVLARLRELVEGKGFICLKDTSEFVQGGKSSFSDLVAEALHQGHYSVNAYLDLHGMDVEGALEACYEFLKDAITKGQRCLAFIHGRGLGSSHGPALKKALIQWLEKGPFRRHIAGYSSAPPWDGGTGVTYCLLKRTKYKRRGLAKKGGMST